MLQDSLSEKNARLLSKLGRELLVFDGAMGSQLHDKGILPGQLPEVCNIEHEDWIIDIHAAYLESGASCIITNTLGANPFHLEDCKYSLGEIINAAITNGKKAIAQEMKRCDKAGVNKDCFLFYNIGPLGQLLQPMGTLSFEDAYEAFKSQVDLIKDQVDGILIETMSDTHEIKAAILAVKENSTLPVFACMTFDENGRTLTGASPEAAVTLLEGLRVDCLGVNCSLGPKELVPVVKRILSIARTPVIVEPNAGLPIYENNETRYNVSMEEFSEYISDFVRMGISCFGGCCGTTPEYIRSCVRLCENEKVSMPQNEVATRVSSGIDCVNIGERTVICGERLNPTGKKKLKEALTAHRLEDVMSEGIAQEKAGAHILDVNVGVPGIDEAQTMVEVIKGLQEILSLPLQIDSTDPAVIARACRIYNGKPLINSVNGKESVMEEIFPIVKKYGGVVIGLTLDEKGIPETAEERVAIAERIIEKAETYGIDKSDIIIDCLVLTVSAQQEAAMETLKAVRAVRHELNVCTVLGLSNISFGLPNRHLINQTFLTMALHSGLSMPILNPLDRLLIDAIDAYEVLSGKDEGSEDYVRRHVDDMEHVAANQVSNTPSNSQTIDNIYASVIQELIITGRKAQIEEVIEKELKEKEAMTIINGDIIPALNEVGIRYDKGKIFLPQLIVAAETAKKAFSRINIAIDSGSQGEKRGPVILATVEGDIHDIGKNIVRVVLESYGFDVIDLGKDVPVQDVVDAYKKYQPKLIGLSALMTTTVASMAKTIEALKREPGICPIVVGGAVLTADTAEQIGADYYAKDAMESAVIAGRIMPEKT